MYRMSKTQEKRNTPKPQPEKSKKNVEQSPKVISFGRKSGEIYSDTDESDNELNIYVEKKTHDKPKYDNNNSVIHSEMSAMKVYDDNGIPRPTGIYPGGKRKTRRPKKSRRQTKRRRVKK
jgi:hypothetical protein